jgi:hypothetical protein
MNLGILTYIAATGILAAFFLGLLIITAIVKKLNLKIWVKYQVPATKLHIILSWLTVIFVIIHVILALTIFQITNIDFWAGLVALFFFTLAFITGIIKKFNIKIFRQYQIPASKYHYILGSIAVLFVFIHMILGLLIFHYAFVLTILKIIHV